MEHMCKMITIHLIVDAIFSVDSFLYNSSEEEKISKCEIDLLNFFVADAILNSVDIYLQ